MLSQSPYSWSSGATDGGAIVYLEVVAIPRDVGVAITHRSAMRKFA
jgi:hypothetical protein